MTEEMEDLEPQEEFELEPISRKVTLRLRVGLKYETVDSEIIEIQEDGKIVLISPMSGSRPRPVRSGTSPGGSSCESRGDCGRGRSARVGRGT